MPFLIDSRRSDWQWSPLMTPEQKQRAEAWIAEQEGQAAREESQATSGPDYSHLAQKAEVRREAISFVQSLLEES